MSFAKLISSKVLPWLEVDGMERVVVARDDFCQTQHDGLPKGVGILKVKRRGRATRRLYHTVGSRSHLVEYWSEDALMAGSAVALCAVVGGHTDWWAGDYVLHCDEGHCILCLPGVLRMTGAHPPLMPSRFLDGSNDLLNILPRGQGVQVWLTHTRGAQYPCARPGENIQVPNAQVADLITAAGDTAASHLHYWRATTAHLLAAALWLVLRDIEAGRYLPIHGMPEFTENDSAGYDPIKRAQKYMRAHLHEPLTIASVAEQVHLSRAQFARLFHGQTGQTFTSWLTAYRLEVAQSFLKDSEWSVAHISEFTGYKSASHFHHIFRQHFGMTPQQFREHDDKNDPSVA